MDCSPTGNCGEPFEERLGYDLGLLLGWVLPASAISSLAFSTSLSPTNGQPRWARFFGATLLGWPVVAIFVFVFLTRLPSEAPFFALFQLVGTTLIFLISYLPANLVAARWNRRPFTQAPLLQTLLIWIIGAALLSLVVATENLSSSVPDCHADGLSERKKSFIGPVSIDYFLLSCACLSALAAAYKLRQLVRR